MEKQRLARLCQYADIAHSLSHVEKLKQYVVQVPLQYQKAFDAGTYFINQNKQADHEAIDKDAATGRGIAEGAVALACVAFLIKKVPWKKIGAAIGKIVFKT